jgi:hypothetical protein
MPKNVQVSDTTGVEPCGKAHFTKISLNNKTTGNKWVSFLRLLVQI